ncbi:MAG: permease [Lachnospiraceae bacterium]|nr:permease [Lachnospiraceae bacterium]
MEYLGDIVTSWLGNGIFYVFIILALGYLIGGIKIKGISLGDAGVLVVALIFGIVSYELGGQFSIGDKSIDLYNDDAFKATFKLVSNLGTAMFVTSVGLIAGPKFFRSFNKKMLAYIVMGIAVIGSASVVTLVAIKAFGIDASTAVGLLTGALTSTPGFSAAKEVASVNEEAVTAGYAIAYLFGVLGVVLFVQILPKLLKVNIEEERKNFIAASTVEAAKSKKNYVSVDGMGLFPFTLAVAFGYMIGCIKIPGINFSFGASGGTLIAGLILGHFGHIGPLNCQIKKDTLNFMREIGLVLFLVGAGVPGGYSFISHITLKYFIVGILMTLIPMIIGYLVARYIFKLSIFNNLGSITGGMTSTPALGALISVAGTDDVASAYAATYPMALILIVLAAKVLVLL